MRKKTKIVLVVVLVLLAVAGYFVVDLYRTRSSVVGTEQPVVEPAQSEPAQQEVQQPVEESPAVEPVPVEEPAPVEKTAPVREPAVKASARKELKPSKPKEEAEPKSVEKTTAKTPEPEPVREPAPQPVEEKPAPAPTPAPAPAPVPVKEPAPVKEPEPKPNKQEVVVNNDEIVASAEVMPKFKGGGIKKFQEYINENTNYPQVAAEMGIQGRVRVSFVVEKNGTVSNVKVVKSIDPLLDREAIRVVKSSPRWTPGQNGGSPIRVSQNASVLFVLR